VPGRAGASTSLAFSLSDLRIEPTRATLPSRLGGSLRVLDADGGFVERIGLDAVDVGPDLDGAVKDLLRENRMKVGDLGLRAESATLAAADLGSTGLVADELDDPDDDGGVPTTEPNYSDAVPDENGMYHYDFCLRWPVSLDDAGFGEDYGVQPESAWKARGGKVKIVRYGEELFDGFLDFNGCTGTLDLPYHDHLLFIGYSVSEILGNTIVAQDDQGKTEGWLRLVQEAGGSGTKYYTFPPGDTSNLIAVPTFTIARFGSVTGATYKVHDSCRPDGDQCCNCAVGDDLYIDSTRRKFLISHEVGHAILATNAPGFINDCTMTVSSNMNCYTKSDHALDSVETQSCAAMEGWAHFVAVRAYNNPTEGDNPDATLEYWRGSGETVDVEQGPVGGVDTYYEAMCGGNQANSAGRGVELDWLRAFWDYHTNSTPGYRPDTSVMVDEIAANSGWHPDDTYSFITDGVDMASGADQRDRWLEMAQWNGIDH
jgi:hypothetical protein